MSISYEIISEYRFSFVVIKNVVSIRGDRGNTYIRSVPHSALVTGL